MKRIPTPKPWQPADATKPSKLANDTSKTLEEDIEEWIAREREREKEEEAERNNIREKPSARRLALNEVITNTILANKLPRVQPAILVAQL